MHPFARDNIVFLKQGIELLDSIDDALYVATVPPVFGSSVGSHMRHILDHFDCLLAGLGSGRVDYDARARDRNIETVRTDAIAAMHAIVSRLAQIDAAAGERALKVKMDGGGEGDTETWSHSSVMRELQFLTSHTIHHYALVAALLGHAGHRAADGFGVSPSTLAYERGRRAQAR